MIALIAGTMEGLAAAKAQGKRRGRPLGALGRSKLDGKEQDIRALLSKNVALLHDSIAARVEALFQLLVQDTTAQDFGLPSSAIRLRM